MRQPKTLTALYVQYQRISHMAYELGRTRARLADPATDGNPTLCRNWGNAESNAAWERAVARVNAIRENVFTPMWHAREHAEHGPTYRPIPCKLCVADARRVSAPERSEDVPRRILAVSFEGVR